MNDRCAGFRHRLERALRQPGAHGVPSELAWHAHLLGCAACRRLLEAEEALEVLLATLPEPQLPPDLAARVLAALASERRPLGVDALDRLLELDLAEAAPAGLAARVRSALAGARAEAHAVELAEERAGAAARRLDRLLELVPAPPAAPGLAQRVLAGLAAAREAERGAPVRRAGALLAGRPVTRWAAAAAVVVGLGLGLSRLLAPAERPAPELARRLEVDVELLSSLDVLENWDLLTSTDLDVLLAELDAFDEELLSLPAEAAPPPPPVVEEDEKHG